MPRERQSTDDDNPFAPPPEGRPDQPWQPRHPSNDGSSSSGSSGRDGDGNGSGSGDGRSDGSSSSGSSGGSSNWGSQWSSRQPGRSSGGGFGGRPSGPRGGQNGQDGPGSGLRWDPTDPAQRRARYALLGGMWAFFFSLFDLPEVALLLGALSVYWAISSLRGAPGAGRGSADGEPRAAQAAPAVRKSPNKQQITASVSGLVMAGLALLIVAASFAAQLVYRDYYTCVNDALTKSGQVACNDLLPEPLRDVLGVQE